MKKKIIALTLALMMLLPLLAACTDNDSGTDTAPETNPAIEETTPADETTDENGADDADADTDTDGDDTNAGTIMNAALSGTFVLEDDPAFSITFSENAFWIPMPYYYMGLLDLDGSFYFSGTFDINESNRTISLSFDEAVILENIVELVWVLLETDPDMQEFFEDPEMEELLDIIVDASIEAMVPFIMDEILEELSELVLTFEDGFDRLYTDYGDAFVRQ
ncbi:MAG: hypothetical protein FWC90_00055 [Oscillospiraceae bacterium]|nr:hypothetical protein [Oscillospiraceae bacterium]